jgi:hypothetical protein
VLLRGGEAFRRQSLVEGSGLMGDVPLKGDIGTLALPVSLFPGCHEVNNPLLHAPTMMYCVPQAQDNRTKLSWTENSETISQNKLFLLLS